MKREKEIDLLKCFCIWGVIVIHLCSNGFTASVASFPWISTLFWGSLVRASVPIFFMCSGVLFLSPERALPLKRLYCKYILRILAAMYVWSFAYQLYHLVDEGTLSAAALWEAFKQILLMKQEFHFYYLHIILLFYALLPVVRVLTRHASRQELRYGLAIWFVSGILYPTVKSFWPFRLLSGIPSQYLLNMTWASLGYGLLGYYLKTWGISKKASAASAVFGFLIIFCGTLFMSVRQSSLYTGFLEGMSVGPALLAAGVFGLFSHWSRRLPAALEKPAAFISRASFCVYLTHMFFVYELSARGINALWLTPLVSVPLIAALVLLLCCGVYFVLSKIPVVRKWLI